VVAAGVNLEHIALRFMEPGENHDVLACFDSIETGHKIRQNFDLRIGAPSRPCLGAAARCFRRE
jgi:hypothetical protein